jgi:two-component system response regulator PilR (NtrC family)
VHKEVELPLSPVDLPDDGIDLDSLMEKYEKELIDTALARAGGNRTKAAGILGISFRSLRYRLKKYDSSED